jgi:antitoxin component YwqK of YwqJK toxin-antitoxin module
MKKLLTIFCLALLVSCSDRPVTSDDIVKRQGLFYKSFTEELFTGSLLEYHINGQLLQKGSFINGKRNGPYVRYDSLGGIERKGEYVNGKKEGQWKDGSSYGEYLNGKKEGCWDEYFMGTNSVGCYINGRKDGIWKVQGDGVYLIRTWENGTLVSNKIQ